MGEQRHQAREEAAQAAIRGELAWTSFDDWSWFAPGEPVGLMSPSEAARAAWKAARQGMTVAVPSSPSVSLDAQFTADLEADAAGFERRAGEMVAENKPASLIWQQRGAASAHRGLARVIQERLAAAAQHAIPEPEKR
jgi:hypothetical protein